MADDKGPNMEVRAFIAVILSLAVMLGYQYFFAPAPQEPTNVPVGATEAPTPGVLPPEAIPGPEGGTEDAQVVGEGALPPETTTTEAATEGLGAVGEEQQRFVTIETDLYRMTIDNRGGRITSLVLTDYTSDFDTPLELVVDVRGIESSAMLDLAAPEAPEVAETANQALYEVTVGGVRATSTVRVERATEIRMQWADGNGSRVDKHLTVGPGSYLSDFSVSAQTPSNTPVFVTLGPGLEMDADTTRAGIYLMRGAVLFDGSSVEHITDDDIETPEIRNASLIWGGIQSNYFVALFAPGGAATVLIDAAQIPAEGSTDDAPEPAADAAAVDGGNPGTRAKFGLSVPPGAVVETPLFMGPKDFDVLASAGHGLERAVDYGRFRILARPVDVVLHTLYDFTGNYGLAIILATLGVRLIFFPLSQSSMKSMRRMQQLQPQMNAIRAKYKGVKDVQKRQEMNTEVMQLYKDNGVSPLGGCLPMLLQMPVLFGFYAAISVSIGIRQAPFGLWLQDLSKMDPFYVLPLLMGAAMYVQQRMSPGTGDPVQQRIFRLMPVMFTFFFLTFPSGLVIYWLMNTVLGIGQQAYVNHQLGAPDAKATPNPKKGKKGKKSNGSKGGGAKRRKRGKR